MSDLPRVLCQFSCGATSAVAVKMALAQYGGQVTKSPSHQVTKSPSHQVHILNAFLENEHEDNRRFAADCEKWFGHPITVLKDKKYGANIITVFRMRGYMKGQRGAPCTTELKRKLLMSVERLGDIIVLGYDASEQHRLDDFKERHPDRRVAAPLIDAGLTKEDCKAMLQRAGIALPKMYEIGYDNANCKGCVKGGEAYFRAIREDFPEDFEELCKVQDELGPGSYLFRDRKTGVRFSLRELGDGPVRRNDALPSCSFFCEMAEAIYAA